jgi:hypothetical protein
LLGRPNDLATAATELLSRDEILLLTDAAFAEVMTTLERMDEGVSGERLSTIGRAIVGHPTVAVVDEVLLLRALELVDRHEAPYLDAYTQAIAERSGVGAVVLDGDEIRPVPG